MMRTCIAAAALTLGIAAVAAQSDPITERRALMKAQGAATGEGVKMVKGEEPRYPSSTDAGLA
jgi:cytochrome c556